jgi:hypothetical protein
MSIAHPSLRFKLRSTPTGVVNRYSITLLVVLFALNQSGCDAPSQPAQRLLTTCADRTTSDQLAVGIGRDGFTATDELDRALIVGGYQGGHHLWGALRLNANTAGDVDQLHLIACQDETIIAEALYGSVDSILTESDDFYGIPVVFGPGVDVSTLEGMPVTIIAAVNGDQGISYATATIDLECCGHVADGD